jgi:hypothetical protein
MRMRYLASIAAIALLSWPVHAADPAPPSEHPMVDSLTAACEGDVKQFCTGVEPGQGRIVRCLRVNEAKLSQKCKDARAAARSHIERKSASPNNPAQ